MVVAFYALRELRDPVVSVFGLHPLFESYGAALAEDPCMPVVAIYEHGDTGSNEDDIGSTRELCIVLTKPEATAVKHGAEGNLRLASRAADGGHVAPDLFRRLGLVIHRRIRSDDEIERKVGNVSEALSFHHDFDGSTSVIPPGCGDYIREFVQGHMVGAVDVSRSDRDRDKSAG